MRMKGVKMRQRYEEIFASPPEPVFNLKPSGMKAELLEDWLAVLAAENKQRINEATINDREGYFKGSRCSEFLFLTCEKLKLAPDTKYLAIELFDRFMTRHVQDLYKHVQSLTTTQNGHKQKDWKAIMDQVRNQVPLRIVSCCQLASKLTSHYRIVSPGRVQSTLKDFGHSYSTGSILQSELRVLKTLNYKVMLASPLVYIETLLELLGQKDISAEVKVYHGICTKLLDLVFMKWKPMYDELYRLATKQRAIDQMKRRTFVCVEKDYMLLSVGIISAASYILDQTHTDKVIESLNGITRIPVDDILDIATVTIQAILESDGENLTGS